MIMRDITQAKAMATTLRERLADDGVTIPHSKALELVAAQFGARDWNTLSVTIGDRSAPITFERAIPILRVFDQAKVDEFYVGFLGFTFDWEHRFEPGLPRYAQYHRSDLIIHLSEHHGDGTPGSALFLRMKGIREFHADLIKKQYGFYRPGLDSTDIGLCVTVVDPFGNTLRFCEQPEDRVRERSAGYTVAD